VIKGHSLRERLRYRVDNLITKSPVSQILALAVLSVLIIILGTIAVSSAAPDDLLLEGREQGVVYRLWWSFTRLVDPGTFINDSTSALVAVTGIVVTLGGILVFSMLIGILSSKIGEKLDELKRGKSTVIEEDHTIIVGGGDKLFEIVRELVEAFEHMDDNVIAVFSPVPKEEMEETLKERIQDFGSSRVVCRTGKPTDLDALRKMGFDRAKSFLVLGDQDEEVVKILLAVWSLTAGRPLRAVCEITDRRMFEIAEMAYQGVRWIPVTQVVMRLMVQVVRQPGLSAVYSEILSFSGNEFYFVDVPDIDGTVFADVCFRMRAGILVGISRGEQIVINPAADQVLHRGDRLLVLTDNCESCSLEDSDPMPTDDLKYARTAVEEAEPERILILSGESTKVSFMLGLMDSYVQEGSEITVAGSLPVREGSGFLPQPHELQNSTVQYLRVDMTSHEEMKSLNPMDYDSILVLSGQGRNRDDEEADSRCIIALLILRRIREEVAVEESPIIVSEIRNPRNRKLASAARIDDFVVSNEVTSMIMAQLSVQPNLWDVYFEIFDPSGCEIQMRQFESYCSDGESVVFRDLMKKGLCRKEIVIGYLQREHDGEDRVELNPPKDRVVTPGPEDMVVIIAER
jgi:Trk K+ transport system NAD-binding subunit